MKKLSKPILESKQDKENFKKWIIDSNTWRGMSQGNFESFVNSWLNDFETYRQNLKPPYNDYYYWIKLNDWDKFTETIYNLNKHKETKQKAKEGARLVYSDDDWKVYAITNYEASVKYGKGTKWCISGSKDWGTEENGKTNWDNYSNRGIKFYFFINKDGHKYALCVLPTKGDEVEIFNDADMTISYIPNAPKVEELKDYNYSIDSVTDYDIILNGIINNKLPFNTFASCVWDVFENYFGADFAVFDNINDYIDYLSNHIPDGFVEHEAVANGTLSAEEYENITGETYKDYWDGDLPVIDIYDIGSEKFSTKEEYLKVVYNADKNNKYFIVINNYNGWSDYLGIQNWTLFLMQISARFEDFAGDPGEYEKELKEDFKTVTPQTVVFALMAYRIKDKNILKQLGCSEEFINNSIKEMYNINEDNYMKEKTQVNESYTINGKTFNNLKDFEKYCADIICKVTPCKELTKEELDEWEY